MNVGTKALLLFWQLFCSIFDEFSDHSTAEIFKSHQKIWQNNGK